MLAAGGRPTTLDNGRARACCICSRCELGLFGYFFLSPIISFFFHPPSGMNGWMDDLGFYFLFNRI